MKNVIGVGAGGHARVVIDTLSLEREVDIQALVDADPRLHGQSLYDIPILGDDSLLRRFLEQGLEDAFVGIGGGGDSCCRQQAFHRLKEEGFRILSVVHPHAYVSARAELEEGVQILVAGVVNAGAEIGRNSLVNSGAVVEHDCIIQRDVHIATGARLGGGVLVEAGAHVGMGATVIQGVRIGGGIGCWCWSGGRS